MPAIAAMPANANALADIPLGDALPQRINGSDNLVTRHTRILNAGQEPVLDDRIAVADSAGLDFDSHRIGRWIGYGTFDYFEGAARAGDLSDAHFVRHNRSALVPDCLRRTKSDTDSRDGKCGAPEQNENCCALAAGR
jgi:hypothetical protein